MRIGLISLVSAFLMGIAFPLTAMAGNPDTDGDGVVDSLDNCVLTPNAPQTNTDGDARGNACDNCNVVANDQAPLYQGTSAQCDADTDGYGNGCDCDFNQDGNCNALDIGTLAANFNKAAVPNVSDVGDANCDGNVNALDLGNLAGHFNKAMATGAKTSGLPCASATLARPGGCNTAFGE